MSDLSRTVNVVYRHATHMGSTERDSLEAELRVALSGSMADDYLSTQFTFNDAGDKALLDDRDVEPPSVYMSVHELGGTKSVRFIRHPRDQKQARPSKLTRTIPELEDVVASTSYLLVKDNHVALIESAGLRSGGLASYISHVLHAAGRLGPDEEWKLKPRTSITDASRANRDNITHLQIKPRARLHGEAASRKPQDRTRRVKPTRDAAAKRDRGPKVSELLETLGAPRDAMADWQAHMSQDLGLEARLIVAVRHNGRGSDAALSGDDFAEALLGLEAENEVTLVTPQGSQRGTVATLKARADLTLTDDGLDARAVALALKAALESWAAKGSITIVGA